MGRRGEEISLGTLHLLNNIIANSTGGGDCVGSGIAINTNNLIEDNSCSPSFSGDPMLGSLADNGGPTETMALQAGSPAIDAGDETTCESVPVNNLDQRRLSVRLTAMPCSAQSATSEPLNTIRMRLLS